MWLTGPVAPRHVGSSQTRARTRVPCIGRQILNHCATREAPEPPFKAQIASHSEASNLQWLPIPNPLTWAHKALLDLASTSLTLVLYYPPPCPLLPPNPRHTGLLSVGRTHETVLLGGSWCGNAVPPLAQQAPFLSKGLS